MNPRPSFQSPLGPGIAAYLDLMQALGREFRTETAVLADLDRFLFERRASTLDSSGFAAWAVTLARYTPTVRRSRMRLARNLCLYLRRSDPTCFVPDADGFPPPGQRPRPFIFSEEQILALLREADKLPATPGSPLRAEVYRLAIVLLYTTGLRRGELVRLRVCDYDRQQRAFLIRASKFNKSRKVALSADAAREVDAYLARRGRLPCAQDAPLLANGLGPQQAYSGPGLASGFRYLCRAAGILTAAGKPPRVHDVRHTYAIHVLLRWYHAGVDPQAKLTILAAAMGHVSPASTAYYLMCLEPVAEAAARRFADHVRPILNSLAGNHRG